MDLSIAKKSHPGYVSSFYLNIEAAGWNSRVTTALSNLGSIFFSSKSYIQQQSTVVVA